MDFHSIKQQKWSGIEEQALKKTLKYNKMTNIPTLQDIQNAAKEKFQQLNAAYEDIKKQRNIN